MGHHTASWFLIRAFTYDTVRNLLLLFHKTQCGRSHHLLLNTECKESFWTIPNQICHWKKQRVSVIQNRSLIFVCRVEQLISRVPATCGVDKSCFGSMMGCSVQQNPNCILVTWQYVSAARCASTFDGDT